MESEIIESSSDEDSNDDLDKIEADSQFESPGVEKEIVQEMIRDFIGDEKTDEVLKSTEDETEKPSDTDLPGIESLENELLNIFEDLDNADTGIAREEITFEEIKEIPAEVGNNVSDLYSPLLKEDDIDEFIKSIDEVSVSGNEGKAEIYEIKSEVIEEISEPQKPAETEKKVVIDKKVPEEKPKITRPARQKDLFSYLRRKELKKIVSYIFANDEEDFTNTVERIMDCNSYKEASEILKAVFTSYKISPYSKEAITFTNGVSNYFRQA
jgi:hypothetical protein